MCCICLQDKGEYINLKCGHSLHKKCLKNLLKYSNNCPMCRAKIFDYNMCDCFIFSPYVNLGECRYCFGISKSHFNELYGNILNI